MTFNPDCLVGSLLDSVHAKSTVVWPKSRLLPVTTSFKNTTLTQFSSLESVGQSPDIDNKKFISWNAKEHAYHGHPNEEHARQEAFEAAASVAGTCIVGSCDASNVRSNTVRMHESRAWEAMRST